MLPPAPNSVNWPGRTNHLLSYFHCQPFTRRWHYFFLTSKLTKLNHVPLLKVLPDYLKALLSVVPQGKASDQHLQQIARLAALQHRAKDTIYLPTL